MRKEYYNYIILFCVGLLLVSCGAQKESLDSSDEEPQVSESQKKEAIEISDEEQKVFESQNEEAVKISDEESEYEIIILEPGFNAWLLGIARPPGYYSQEFLEIRNNLLVLNWNQRVLNPFRYDPNLYQFQIDYDPRIDYGYEVNYKLYNYFIFFQRRFNQRLSGYLPRI